MVTALELGVGGKPDVTVLAKAVEGGRVVITHDSDFGLLAVGEGKPCIGLIYLRPGHIQPAYTLQSVEAIETTVGSVHPGFILVAEHRTGEVRIRLRNPFGSATS